MKLPCLLGRHRALPSNVRNLGLRVSQCRCCGRDMIRCHGRWTTVPRGFHIVWRRLDEVLAEAVPLKLTRNLPVPRQVGRVASFARRVAETLDLAGAALSMAGWSIADACRGLTRAWQALRGPQQLVLPLYVPRQTILTGIGSLAMKTFCSIM